MGSSFDFDSEVLHLVLRNKQFSCYKPVFIEAFLHESISWTEKA